MIIMIQNEYEIITHNNNNFHIFLVNLLYRTPHIHKDYEISLVVDGTLTLINPLSEVQLTAGDFFVMNPFFSHELKARTPALILSLQVSSDFFGSCYPQIEQTEFDTTQVLSAQNPDVCHTIRSLLFSLAYTYYDKEGYAPLKCASLIYQLFFYLLSTQKHHTVLAKEKQAAVTKGTRIWNILRYTEEHFTEKILLTDIARRENLDLYYLSHFFKESVGISFQNYVMKLRCEKARQLLLLSDYSLLDISLICGFSDPKYFNKGFETQYGCTPKAYRKNFQNAKLEPQQKSMLTTQEFLSESASLVTLEKYSSRQNLPSKPFPF